MDIHQVEWHPNDSSILATASMDQTVKVWNISDVKRPLCSIKNSEVGKIHWLDGGETGSHSIGIGSKSMDKIMTIWDLSEPYCPQYAFKNKNKSCITDFAFSRNKQTAYLISQDNYVIVQSVARATSIMDERRGNSLACDLTDGYVFGWDTKSVKSGDYSISDIDKNKKTKQSKRLNFINVTNFKSCYEETENPFETMDEEYLHFITGYKTEGGKESIMPNLYHNKALALKYGKTEISSIWNSLYDLMEEDKELLSEESGDGLDQSVILNERRRKVSMNTRTERERTQLIVKYYRENWEQLEYDLQTNKINIMEAEIRLHEDYEYVLLAKIDQYFKDQKVKDQKQSLTLSKKSEIISKILQDMIDNGEFIHAYKMYSTLSDYVNITEEKRKLWDYTYIDILVTMGFYTRATETIKNSKVDTIKNMNKNDTVLKIKCIKCGKQVPKNGKGYCEKCQDFSVYCAVCSRPCKGLMLWCQICSHGGHVDEIIEWFTVGEDGEGKTCPTGCGCKCFKF